MEDFIRQNVRRILAEDGKETAILGRQSERVKEFGNLAESNPARIAQSFQFSGFSPGGSSNSEKIASLLRYIKNNDNDMMAIIADVKVEGNDVKIFPKKVEAEGKVIDTPTGRLARYIGALIIAAAGIGKFKFEKEKRNILHMRGEYVIVKGS